MKRLPIALLVLAAAAASPAVSAGTPPTTYHLAATFPIGGPGGWDYTTVDSEHHLVFITRSTHSQVIDAATGKVVADIPGQLRSHGVALVPALGRGFISDGKDGSVMIFDLATYAVLGKIKAADDADGIIYDKGTNKVLVACGDAGVLVPISADVNPATGSADAAIDLGGKPEFLAADGHGMAYVNLVEKNQVVAVDLKASKVVAIWPTAPGGSPVGLSMDTVHRRLFVGCRNPNMMVVLNADTGAVVAGLPIGSGCDATAFDGNAWASTGDGFVTVVGETSPGTFEVLQNVATGRGARTMGIDTSTHSAYFPTADFEPATDGGRPHAKPDSFKVLVVTP